MSRTRFSRRRGRLLAAGLGLALTLGSVSAAQADPIVMGHPGSSGFSLYRGASAALEVQDTSDVMTDVNIVPSAGTITAWSAFVMPGTATDEISLAVVRETSTPGTYQLVERSHPLTNFTSLNVGAQYTETTSLPVQAGDRIAWLFRGNANIRTALDAGTLLYFDDPLVGGGVVGSSAAPSATLTTTTLFATATLQPTPVISSVTPVTGPAAGGNTVTISGTDFEDASQVMFGDTPATNFTVADDGDLTTYRGDGGRGVLMLHLHNEVGNKAQAIELHAQAITFVTRPPAGASVGATYHVAASGGDSGVPVGFSTTTPAVCSAGGTNGATIVADHEGTCTVQADQAGDADYDAAPPVTQTFTIAKGKQSIVFYIDAGTTPVVGGTARLTGSGGPSGNPVTFTSATPAVCTIGGDGASALLVAPGLCQINATQAGNDDYEGALIVTSAFLVAAPPVVAHVDPSIAARVTSSHDRVNPTLKLTGVRAGAAYRKAPRARCVARDTLSKVASCIVKSKKTKGSTVTYSAKATDRAGNVRTLSLRVRLKR